MWGGSHVHKPSRAEVHPTPRPAIPDDDDDDDVVVVMMPVNVSGAGAASVARWHEVSWGVLHHAPCPTHLAVLPSSRCVPVQVRSGLPPGLP